MSDLIATPSGASLSARITTGFNADTTAEQAIAGIDLTGKRAIVTGGASGIGVETARVLADAGADVTIAARNLSAAREVADGITASTGRAVHVAPLELDDPASVRAFAAAWEGPLHLLINNAGVMATPLTRTAQGWELQLATNHIGHFGLATGLHAALAAAGGARVVSLSSAGHHYSPIVFDDLHYERRDYHPFTAYGQSKTANILLGVEGTRRWADDGIFINAVHPGTIRTNLARHVDPIELEETLRKRRENDPPGLKGFKTVEEGAATTIVAATSPLFEGVGGRYLEDGNQAVPHEEGTRWGVSDYALDPEAAARLWTVSEEHLASV